MVTDKNLEGGSRHLFNTTNLPAETTENHGKETSIRIANIADQIKTWVPLHIKSQLYRISVLKTTKRPLGRPICRWVDNIKMDL
jgi:hypothetical protein